MRGFGGRPIASIVAQSAFPLYHPYFQPLALSKRLDLPIPCAVSVETAEK